MDVGPEKQAPTLTVHTLGRLEIQWDRQSVPGLKLRKAQALLVYLALNPGRHPRSRLAGLLWGGQTEQDARRSLRHVLWLLRQHLDPAILNADRVSVGLNAVIPHRVDVLEFESAIEEAGRCQQEGKPVAAARHLETAIALYQGDFLARLDLSDCPEFEEWVLRRRTWLRERALEALMHLVEHCTRRGEYDRALQHGQRLLALDPWREAAHCQVMTLLALTGQRSAALAQYEECRRLLETELGLEPLEETTTLYERILEGAEEPFDYAQDTQRGRGDFSFAPPLPFVGREAEHATLVDWWETSRRGEGRLVLVEGEAGVGKTRLVEEVIRYAEAQGTTVLRGRCYEFGSGLPYQPIAAALRAEIPIIKHHTQGTAPISNLGDVWLAELARLVPEVREMRPDLPEPAYVTGEAARQRLFEAVARFLLTSDSSLLIFLDDLHWADQSTLDMLHYLVRHLSDATSTGRPSALLGTGTRPVWLVGAYRPEEVDLSHPLTRLRQGLSRDRLVDRLVLEPLAPAAVGEIAFSLVGEDEGVAFGDLLYRESEGNPFILVETVSDWQEQGILRGEEEGRWQWVGPPQVEPGQAVAELALSKVEGTLPAGVQDVVLQRVGRLSEPAQRLLTLAAVVGRGFDTALLQAAAGADAVAVDESLEAWLTRRLISPQSGAEPGTWDFAHDKIRAVVYHAAGAVRRRTLHRQVGGALERLSPARIEERVGLLAYHWERGGEPQKATEYLVRAGDQARLVYAHQEAIDYYRRALACLKEQGNAGRERAARTLMKLGLTYHNALDFQRARQAYDEGFALWQRAGAARPALRPPPPAPHALRVHWLEPTTLDPTMSPDEHTSCLIAHLFSGLVELSPEMDVVPDMARTWDVLDSGRKYVFHLRDDVRWSDGTPVTAEDFWYGWQRALAPHPAIGSPAAGLMHDIRGARAFHRGEGRWEDVGVRALDEVTLVVELEGPTGYFPQLLTHPAYYPVPRHVVEACGAAWTEAGNIVTNGPFRLETWNRGELLVFSRNPEYHGRFKGNLQRVEMFLLTEWSARLQMYEAGDVDIMGILFFPPAEREAVRQRYAGEYVSRPGSETYYVTFDVSRSPFDDARVRRALALATDKETLANVIVQGYVSPATGGFVPPGTPGHSPGIGLPYDPEQARQLLVEAGYPGGRGFPVVDALVFHPFESRCAYLQAQWRANLGIEIAWESVDWSELLDRLRERPPHLYHVGWVADYPDPDNFLRVSHAKYWAGWRNETYDRLVEKARRATDQGERMKLYGQADRILVQEAPILPLTYARTHLLVKPWVSQYRTSAIRASFWKDVIIEPH